MTERLTEQLTELVAGPDNISAFVAREAISHDEALAFFSDLFQHGCVSGMVTSLVYYHQTAAFFDRYYEEIEDIRDQTMEDGAMPDWPQGDLKNWMAWFAFEEVARRMVSDILELDL